MWHLQINFLASTSTPQPSCVQILSKATTPLDDLVRMYGLPLPNLSLFMKILVSPSARFDEEAILISVIPAGPAAGFVSTEAAGEGVELAFGVVALATGIGTPLFQIIFLPDLIAVNLLSCQSRISPTRFGFNVGPSAAKTEELKIEKTDANAPASIPRRFIELMEKS